MVQVKRIRACPKRINVEGENTFLKALQNANNYYNIILITIIKVKQFEFNFSKIKTFLY